MAEKNHNNYMVSCLYEEIRKTPLKYSEMDTIFIKSLNTKFFENPEYVLSEKQKKWLDIIWQK